MSVTPIGKIFSIGGFLEYLYDDGYVFTDTTSNDIGLYSDYKDQHIIFGTEQGALSALRITSNEVQFNHNIYVGQSISVGTCNVRNYPTPHRFVLEGQSNSIMGPHMAAYLKGDSNNPLFQQYNNNHDDLAMSFDAYWNGSNWVSSHSNNNFQIRKNNGILSIQSACNNSSGTYIDDQWYNALTINSNSLISIGSSNATHRLTINGPSNDIFNGPSIAFCLDNDKENPVYQQVHLDHDNITQSYDSYLNSNNQSISTSSNANFQIQKKDGLYMIHSACNNAVGDIIDWNNALTINSNSFIGIGTSNVVNRITINAENNSINGPHIRIGTNADNYPLYQQVNWKHDFIAQSYDSYYENGDWLSASEKANYQIQKRYGVFSINAACNVLPGDIIDWKTALSINSNSYVNIGVDFTNFTSPNRFTVFGTDSSILGPHIGYYTNNDNYPLYQQVNWRHDDISQVYDAYWSGSNWISSTETANFLMQKKNGRLSFLSSSNINSGDEISWKMALSINSNSYIDIGGSNPYNRLNVTGPINDNFGPHMAFCYTDNLTTPSFQIYNSNFDDISLNFNSYNDGYNSISSSESGNFKIHKINQQLLFQSVTFAYSTSNIDTAFKTAIAINSNSYVGIGHSNPTMTLDVMGKSIFRDDINISGNILPNSNSTMDLGSSTNRFRDLWLSGNSIDMEGLKLKKDTNSRGLFVYDLLTDKPGRVIAKELLLGTPTDLLNSNVYLIRASSNGLQLDNVTGNQQPPPYSQLNNMFVTQQNVGIGLSNPEKTLQVIGDIELNPNEIFTFSWSNLIIRMEQHDILNNINKSIVTQWGSFNSNNTPIYYKEGGYNNSPYIQCTYNNSYFISNSNYTITSEFNNGFTAMILARFNRDPQSNETLFSFSNSNYLFRLGRNSNTNDIIFSTKDNSLTTLSNVIMQNQWALFTVKHSDNTLNLYKNGSNIVNIPLSNIPDMSFISNEMILGNANVDLSSFYLFDRPLFDSELENLTKKIIYPGHKSLQIRTDGQMYPPADFFNDTFGWNTVGKRNGGQVYEKVVENIYYGNGTYKIWANTETTLEPAYYTFDASYNTGWKTAIANYNTTLDSSPAPTLYIEMPFPMRVYAYKIASKTTNLSQTPSKWNLYGSINGITWITLDQIDKATSWYGGEERTYYICNADACKIFKLEILRNDSYPSEYISLSKFIIYGDEYQFVVDGTGIGINTNYPKEALTIDGNAYISSKLTIGKFDDTLKLNLFEWPPIPLANYSNICNLDTYTISASTFSQITNEPYRAFTKDINDYWSGETDAYYSTGYYIGTHKTVIDGVERSGDWLQINLSKAIKLHSYKLLPNATNANITGPLQFYIAGSLDGTIWNQIDFIYAKYWLNNSGSELFYINGDKPAYSYYRIVIQKIGTSSTNNSVCINDMSLYGTIYTNAQDDFGEALIRGKLQVSKNIILAPENTEKLFDCSADSLKINHIHHSICKDWGQFSSLQNPIFYSTPKPSLYLETGCFMDAGITNLSTTAGFTFIISAKFITNCNDATLICLRDNNSNHITFGKIDNTSTLHFIINNYNLNIPITLDEWHVYSIRYQPNRIELYIDGNLIKYSNDSITIPTTFTNTYINNNTNNTLTSKLHIASLLAWNIALSDSELMQQIDYIYTSASMYINGNVRFTDGIQGDIEIKSIDSFSETTYIYPPSGLTQNVCMLKKEIYGNGTYKSSSSSSIDNINSFILFDRNDTTNWSINITYPSTTLTNMIDGSYLFGEWTQIDLPTAIILKYYIFVPNIIVNTPINPPTSWTLVGSDDGEKWSYLGANPQINTSWGDPFSIYLLNTKPYHSYRWIFNTSVTSTIELKAITLYGQISSAFSTRNTNVVVFDKLGINVTEPAASLHVAGFSILSGLKIIAGNASNINLPPNLGGGGEWSGSVGTAILGYSNEPTGTALSIIGNNASYAFRFLTSTSNEMMRLNGLGNLGINTTNPTEKLHVNGGNAKFSDNVYIMKNLGIGKTNPQASLDVSGQSIFNSNITFNDKLIGIKLNTELSEWAASITHNYVNTSFAMGGGRGILINTGSVVNVLTEPYASDYYNVAALECKNDDYGSLFYVRNDGHIGIGTSNASETLSVVGTISLSNYGKSVLYTYSNNLGIGKINPIKTLDVLGDINYTGHIYHNGIPVPEIEWSFNNNSNIYSSTNIGINTSNILETLTIGGGSLSLSNYGKTILYSSNTNFGINTSNTSETLTIGGPSLSLSNNGKSVLYTNNNYLGIGTTNPLFTLDVNGDLNINGNLYKNNNQYINSQWINNLNNIYFPNIGYVGIGTSSPQSALHVVGNITTYGNIIPGTNITYDLGSSTNMFRDLYLSGNSIHMSSTKLSTVIQDGSLKISDISTGSLKKVIVNELQIGSVDNPNDSNIYSIKVIDGDIKLINSTTGIDTYTSIINGLYTSNNNIGINMLNPIFTLDIAGDINLTGNIYKSGLLYQGGGNSSSDFQSNINGIFINNNVCINANDSVNNVDYALCVIGTMSLSNNNGSVKLFTKQKLLGINTSNIVETLTIGGPSLSLSNNGKSFLYTNNNYLGIGTTNPLFTLDVHGDLNINGNLYKSGALFQSSRWTCNLDGIYINSNIGVGMVPNSNSSLITTGPISLSNSNGLVSLYGNNSKLGINNQNPLFNLDIAGDINFTGQLYKNNILFSTTNQWIRDANGIYINSNIVIKCLSTSNTLSVLGDTYLNGNLNINGALLSGGLSFETSKWNKSSNAIYTYSNVSIGTSNGSNALTVSGNISIDRGLMLRGIQIFKNNGIMANITQQVVNIPGASNSSSNIFFYNGLYLGGLRLSAGIPNKPSTVLYASSNILGYSAPLNGNSMFSIPTDSPDNYFKFVTGDASNEVLTITGDGRIGINTNTPLEGFHTTTNVLISGQSLTINNNGNPYLEMQNTYGTAILGMAGNAQAYSLDSVAGDYIIKNFTGGKIILQTGNVGNSICINSNNNVGIKNSSPLYSLDIIGDINFSGNLRKNGVTLAYNASNIGLGNTNPQFSIDITGATSTVLNTTSNNNPTIGSTNRFALYSGDEIVLQSGANAILLDGTNKSLRPWTDSKLDLGLSGLSWKTIYTLNGIIQTSDSQDKDYVPLTYGLSNLMQIQTIKYKWKSQASLPDTDPDKYNEYYGVLADQVDKLFPELVYNKQKPYQLNYTELIPILINSIKELNNRINSTNNCNSIATSGDSNTSNTTTTTTTATTATTATTNCNYIEVVMPIELNSSIKISDFTIAGITKDGRLTNKFSESLSFTVVTQNNKTACAGRVQLNMTIPCAAGDYIIPKLGSFDSIDAYSVNDFRISFNEYKSKIGKVLCLDVNGRPLITI